MEKTLVYGWFMADRHATTYFKVFFGHLKTFFIPINHILDAPIGQKPHLKFKKPLKNHIFAAQNMKFHFFGKTAGL